MFPPAFLPSSLSTHTPSVSKSTVYNCWGSFDFSPLLLCLLCKESNTPSSWLGQSPPEGLHMLSFSFLKFPFFHILKWKLSLCFPLSVWLYTFILALVYSMGILSASIRVSSFIYRPNYSFQIGNYLGLISLKMKNWETGREKFRKQWIKWRFQVGNYALTPVNPGLTGIRTQRVPGGGFQKKEAANRNNRYAGVVEENSKRMLEWVRELKERRLRIMKHD